MLDDRLYLFTTSGAPRGRLFSVDPARPDRAHWREVIKESAEVLQDVAYFRGGLAAASLQDAALRLRLYDADGTPRGEIALPGLGALTGLTGARDVAEIGYGFTSFLTPTEVFRVDVTTPKAPAATTWRKLQAPIDAAAFEVERVMVTSRDGTKLPLFLAHRKGTKRDGAQPAAADRLRRLRPQHAADLDAVGDPVSRGRRHLRASPSCAAAASTARTGTAPACSAASRTCSTTSSRRPSG